ncbi:bifunctional DNA primase/polymerase [uncultured Roseovarius sp.]|uniref:bifunctional DNA primase/polymerase n=1 Tax=uncultured Roseovarius sp. TaxID=293344 RepID=UPI0025947762|nr:bifunctional DNA primase/polymerase [uncultured Roseovarius sp.]
MNMLEHALAYADRGWAVFPTHGIKNRACTCGKQSCTSPGKHPIFSGGFKHATTDYEQITEWFTQNPFANIAIATGAVSGVIVIDVDSGEGKEGLTSVKAIEERYGPLPKTFRVRTGSGGWHYYIAAPSIPIKSSVSRLGKDIDVRAEGGYVIAPPSKHISGNTYKWETDDDE